MAEEKEEKKFFKKLDPYTKGIKVYTDKRIDYTLHDKAKDIKFHLSKLTDDGNKSRMNIKS
jgi:hypothetical protein